MNLPNLRNGISTIVNTYSGIDYLKDAANFNFSLIKEPLYGGYKWTVSKLSNTAVCELKDKKVEISIPALKTLVEQGKESVISNLNDHVITLQPTSHNPCELNIECVNLSYVGIAKTMFIVFLNQYYILKAKIKS